MLIRYCCQCHKDTCPGIHTLQPHTSLIPGIGSLANSSQVSWLYWTVFPVTLLMTAAYSSMVIISPQRAIVCPMNLLGLFKIITTYGIPDIIHPQRSFQGIRDRVCTILALFRRSKVKEILVVKCSVYDSINFGTWMLSIYFSVIAFPSKKEHFFPMSSSIWSSLLKSEEKRIK